MAMISVYLDAVLTAWIADRTRRDELTAGWVDETATAIESLQQHRDAIQAARAQDYDNLHHLLDINDRRWEERLVRVDEWNAAIHDLRSQHAELLRQSQGLRLLEKISEREPRWSQRFTRQFQRLSEDQAAFHESLARWIATLEPRRQEVARLEAAPGKPAMVASRAVLDPEKSFVTRELRWRDTLEFQMNRLRASANRLLNRLERLDRSLYKQAGNSISPSSGHLNTRLSEFKQKALEVRYHVLSDALDFEGAKRTLKAIDQIVQKVRCLEEVSRRPSFWDRLFNSD